MEREEIDNVWESVYYTPDMKTRVKDMAPKFIEFLMTLLLMEDEINIGQFKDENGSYGTMVTYDIYDSDKILQVRYKNDTSFDLHIAVENDEGVTESFYHTLTEKEIEIIPEGLQILMKKAFNSGDELVWRPGAIDQ